MQRSQIMLVSWVLAGSLSVLALPVLADEGDIQRSSYPQGMRVDGNAELHARQSEATAVSAGEMNVAGNAAASMRGGVQIRGNTRIKAEQKNATAVAVGKNNAANNEAGVIGGK